MIDTSAAPALRLALFTLASVFVYGLPLVLLYLFFWGDNKQRIQSTKVFLTTIFSWQVLTTLIGGYLYSHYGFRDRPFAQLGLTEFLFEQPQKAFPSDHATVMMTVGLSFLVYRYRRLGWVFIIGGILSSLGRVMVGFHWLGDVVGGWLVAAISVGLFTLIDRPLTRVITTILRSVKLWKNEQASENV